MTEATERPLTVPVVSTAGTAKGRVYVTPAAGRGVGWLSQWAAHTPPGVELWGVRLPGRESSWTEPPIASVQEAAARLAHEVEEHHRSRGPAPLVLYGHSLGAYVAFATALLLEQRHSVELVVAGAGAPIGPTPVQRHLFDDHELTQELRRFGATPQEILDEPELLTLFLPLLRADFRLAETYVPPAGGLHCPITAYGASDDFDVPLDTVRQWGQMTSGRFDFCSTTGGHFFPDRMASRILGAPFQPHHPPTDSAA